MSKGEILHYFQDINFMYNDCGMKDTLSKCLDEYADEIRADAIDELMPFLKSDKYDYDQIIAKAEQIKEQKNE